MEAFKVSTNPLWRSEKLSVPDGEILGLGRSAVYAATRLGELPTLRIGVPMANIPKMLGELGARESQL